MAADEFASKVPSAPAAAPRPQGPRVPTLCRLICQAFEAFLGDRIDNPRMPGLIPRAMIAPWWNAITALCGDELVRFELKLKTIIGTGEFEEADQLAQDLQKAAIGWNLSVLAAIEQASTEPSVAALTADPLLVADIREVARILPMAGLLKSQLALTFSLLAEDGQMEGRRIYDLSADAVALLRQQYAQFAERVGAEAGYFALALVNRMMRPWQILLVARAIGWRPHEPGSRYAEFDTVAQRLVLELKRLSGEIAALTRREDLAGVAPAIRTTVVRYFDEVEGVIETFGPAFTGQGDAAWNTLGETRAVLAALLDRRFVDRLVKLVLRADEPDGESAIVAAGILASAIEHGPRYGFAGEARDCRARVGVAIEAKAGAMIAELRNTPTTDGQARSQAMLRVIETVLKDAAGVQLARNLRMARQVSAA
ncbi:MAG: hypothetical protein KGJ66_06745 [Alphaproteobacteria bacterium]|nr:hypothetical protein [Alphaproteobacteria bacterium]